MQEGEQALEQAEQHEEAPVVAPEGQLLLLLAFFESQVGQAGRDDNCQDCVDYAIQRKHQNYIQASEGKLSLYTHYISYFRLTQQKESMRWHSLMNFIIFESVCHAAQTTIFGLIGRTILPHHPTQGTHIRQPRRPLPHGTLRTARL